MFFLLSKTLGALAYPMNLALVLLGLALLLRLLKKGQRARRWLVVVAIVELWVLSTGVVANLLLHPLETRYSRPEQPREPPAAIVVLTGMTNPYRLGPGYYELSAAADRLVEALRLAKLHPRSLVVVSGGSSSVFDTTYREADILSRLAGELGLPPNRLLVDRDSRNTRENAVSSARLLAQARAHGPVLLVTSASHMPRSVACFAKAGVKVVPWPVDYYRTQNTLGAWLPCPSSLVRSTSALHEYLGWLSYRISGYV